MGCRRVASPDQLVRVVARPGGGLDTGRPLPGRGAWLCADSPSCLDAAVRRKAFERALRTTVAPQAVEDLRITLAGRGRLDS